MPSRIQAQWKAQHEDIQRQAHRRLQLQRTEEREKRRGGRDTRETEKKRILVAKRRREEKAFRRIEIAAHTRLYLNFYKNRFSFRPRYKYANEHISIYGRMAFIMALKKKKGAENK